MMKNKIRRLWLIRKLASSKPFSSLFLSTLIVICLDGVLFMSFVIGCVELLASQCSYNSDNLSIIY